ncbi:MAG: radical SAM protein, partial [Candidatus Omnitrophota bacterium]
MPNKNRGEIRALLEKSYRECFPYLPPVRLDICITTACNTNCAYCWHQKKSGSKLTFESIAQVIDVLCGQRPPKLNLTGGEPTVYPDFERVLEYARISGIKDILLCTNGFRFQDPDFAEKVVELGVTALNVSVDTLDPEKFEKLRGFKLSVMRKVLANLAGLKKKYPSVSITLASVISKMVTPDDLFEVSEFAKKNGFGYFTQTFLKTAYHSVNSAFNLSEKERDAFRQKMPWLVGKVAD